MDRVGVRREAVGLDGDRHVDRGVVASDADEAGGRAAIAMQGQAVSLEHHNAQPVAAHARVGKRAGDRVGDQRLRHLRTQHAAGEQRPHPGREVGHRRDHVAARPQVRPRHPVGHVAHLGAGVQVAAGETGRHPPIVAAGQRVREPERLEQPAPHLGGQVRAGFPLDDHAHDARAQIGVLERPAGRGRRCALIGVVDIDGARKPGVGGREVVEAIEAVGGKPAGVGEELAHGDAVGERSARKPAREHVGNREPSLLDQLQQERGNEGLGDAGDAEAGARVEGNALIPVGETAGEHKDRAVAAPDAECTADDAAADGIVEESTERGGKVRHHRPASPPRASHSRCARPRRSLRASACADRPSRPRSRSRAGPDRPS